MTQYIYNTIMDLRSFQIRFESAIPIRFDSTVMGRIKNFRIGRVCQLLVVFRRLRPLTALSGTVYRLASSMSDHTPVLFNVFAFENWNEESVVRYISFISFVINYWLLNLIFVEMSYTADSIRDSIRIWIVTPDSIRIRFERKRTIRRPLNTIHWDLWSWPCIFSTSHFLSRTDLRQVVHTFVHLFSQTL